MENVSTVAAGLERTVRAWIASQETGNTQSLEEYIRDSAAINEMRSSRHLVALFDEDRAGLLSD